MKPAIGIDLGTTYFCVGVWQEGKVKIIINEEGNRTTPCYVAFMGDEQIVGDAAKNEAMMNPTNTVFDMKRLIGRDYDDQTIQNYLQQWPFKVVKEGGKPNLHMKCHKNVQRFNAEMISSMILTKIKEITDAFMGQEIRDAVITVPTYFNHCQRQATRNAGVKAGLNVMKIINEPIAAAFAYGLEKNLIGEKSVLIFDLGGATFDVSILTIDVDSVFEVKSKAGDMDLGGENFDSRLVDHFCKEFERKYGKNVKNNPRSLRKLRIAAERAKRTLSSSTEATIEIDALYEGIDFYTKVSRTRFEELCADLFRSILKLVKKALAAAKLDKRSIHDIVLVGGSTRIPKIQSMLQSFFCGKLLNLSINPEEAVAYGAAAHAAMLANENSLSSAFQDLRLVDVVPLSLGIETLGYFMNFIIRRKTKIPCSGTLPFTMNRDNERSMTFKIFEGERILTKYNNLLGEIKLTGITPALRGLSKINITFDIDADGILRVTAKDTASGSSNDIKITNCNKGRLRREEIDRMLDDADENEIENERERRRVVMRFELERYILNMGRAALNINKKSGRQLKTKVYNVLRETICWLNDHSSANALELGKVLLDFERVSWPIIREMYYLENGTNCILNVAVKDCDCVE